MTTASNTPRVVNCPRCGQPVPWVAASRYRPFCSARCKGVDLGAWANEEYRIEASGPPDTQDPDA